MKNFLIILAFFKSTAGKSQKIIHRIQCYESITADFKNKNATGVESAWIHFLA